MRKFLVGLGAVSFATAASLMACSSSSGDDSSAASDAGSDTSTDTYVPVTDSGTPDTGTDAGSGCQTCSNFLADGPGALPQCTNNGPPSSAQLITAFFNDCMCNSDGGTATCSSQCSDTCVDFQAPTDTCQTCFASTCSAQLAACAADGADGGAKSDGGDGG